MQSILQMSRTSDPVSISEQSLADYDKLSMTERAKMLKALQRAVQDVERSLETTKSEKDFHSVTDDSAVDVCEEFIGTRTKSGVNKLGNFETTTKVTSIDASHDVLRSGPKFRKSDLNTMAVVGLKGDNIMYINAKRDGAHSENTWSVFSLIPRDANIDIRKAIHFFPYKGHFYMAVGTEVWRKYQKVQDHFEAPLPEQYINEWERVGDEVFPSEYLSSIVPFVKVVGEEVQFHLIILSEEGRLSLLRGGLTSRNEFIELKDSKNTGLKFKKLVYGDEYIVAYDTENNIWNLTPDLTDNTFTAQDKKQIDPVYELTAIDSGLVGVRRDGWLYKQVQPAHSLNAQTAELPKTWEKWIRQNGILHLGMVSPDANLGLEKVPEPPRETRLNGDVSVGFGHSETEAPRSTTTVEIQTTRAAPKTETTTGQNGIVQKEVETLLRNLPVGRIAKRRHGVRGLERLLRELQLLVEEDEDEFEDTYDETLGRFWKQGLNLAGSQKKGEEVILDNKLDNGNLSRGIIKRSEDGRSRYLAVFNQSNLVIAAEDDHRPVEAEPKTVDRVIVVSPPSEPVPHYTDKDSILKEDSFVEVERPDEKTEVETKTTTTEKVTTKSEVKIVEQKKTDAVDNVVETKTIIQETIVEPVPEVRLITALETTTAYPIVTPGWFLQQTIQSLLELHNITLTLPVDVPNVNDLKTLIVQGRDEFITLVSSTFGVTEAFEEWTRRIQEVTVTEADRIQASHYEKSVVSSKLAVDKSGLAGKIVAQLNQAARSQIFDIEKDVLVLENKLRALGHELQDIKHQVWVPTWLRELHGQKQLGDAFSAGASEVKIEAEMEELKIKISLFAKARDVCSQWVQVSQTWLQLCGQISANLGRVYEMLSTATFKLDESKSGYVAYKAIVVTEWRQIRKEAEETVQLLRSASSNQATLTTGPFTTQVETTRTIHNGLKDGFVNVVSTNSTLSEQLELQSRNSRTIDDLLAKLGSISGANDLVAYIDAQDRSKVTAATIIENVRSIYERLATTNHETIDQIRTLAQLQTPRSRQPGEAKVSSHTFVQSTTLNTVSRARNDVVGTNGSSQGIFDRQEASLDKISGYVSQLKVTLGELKVQGDTFKSQKLDFLVTTLESIKTALQELSVGVTRLSEILVEMKQKCEKHAGQLDAAVPSSFDRSHAFEVDVEWQQVESACEKWLNAYNGQGVSHLSYREF